MSAILRTQFGSVRIAFSDRKLKRVKLGEFRRTSGEVGILGKGGRASDFRPDLIEFEDQMVKYFRGEPVDFSIPLDVSGFTDFQKAVWMETSSISYGKVATYGEIAEAIKRPAASRAVGAALGRNPIPIVIPCHRVIAANTALGGFSAGTDWKIALLKLEIPQLDIS